MQKTKTKKKLWGKVANCCLALQYEHFCVVFFGCFAYRPAAGVCLCKTAAIADVVLFSRLFS